MPPRALATAAFASRWRLSAWALMTAAPSRASFVPGSTGSMSVPRAVPESNRALNAFLKLRMTGPSCCMLIFGIHEGFHTTSTSLSPSAVSRSARMSWTSHKLPSMDGGDSDDDNCADSLPVSDMSLMYF